LTWNDVEFWALRYVMRRGIARRSMPTNIGNPIRDVNTPITILGITAPEVPLAEDAANIIELVTFHSIHGHVD
jgi:hypothetical protein